jgi:hypothetical protein
MGTGMPEELRTWGVRCGDGEVLWVEDEAAAHRLLLSLVGAQQVVHRSQHADHARSDELGGS